MGGASRQKRSLLIVNEYFGGKRNDASGTLWTETIYNGKVRGNSGLTTDVLFEVENCRIFRKR
jgi:hypothetical protein